MRILVIAAAYLICDQAFGLPKKSIFGNLSGSYYEFRDITNTAPGTATGYIIDKDYNYSFRAGYLNENGIIFGFSYNVNHWQSDSDLNGAKTHQHYDFKSYGPALGFMYNDSLYAIVAYHLVAEYTYEVNLSNGTTSQFRGYGGTGWEYNLGYAFKVAQNWSVAPQATYWAMKYTLRDTNLYQGQSCDLEKGFTLFGLSVFGAF